MVTGCWDTAPRTSQLGCRTSHENEATIGHYSSLEELIGVLGTPVQDTTPSHHSILSQGRRYFGGQSFSRSGRTLGCSTILGDGGTAKPGCQFFSRTEGQGIALLSRTERQQHIALISRRQTVSRGQRVLHYQSSLKDKGAVAQDVRTTLL